jgi:hypothetical protein
LLRFFQVMSGKFGVMSGFGSVKRSERSGGLKMCLLSRIDVSRDVIGVLGEKGGVREVDTKKPAGCVTGRAVGRTDGKWRQLTFIGGC